MPQDHEPVKDPLLSQLLSGSMTTGDGCPDAEAIAAWSDRSLSRVEASVMEQHLSSCVRCQTVLATLAAAAPPPESSVSLWKQWRLGWLVPIAGTAAALTLYVATGPQPPPSVVPTAGPAAGSAATSARPGDSSNVSQENAVQDAPVPDAAVRDGAARDGAVPEGSLQGPASRAPTPPVQTAPGGAVASAGKPAAKAQETLAREAMAPQTAQTPASPPEARGNAAVAAEAARPDEPSARRLGDRAAASPAAPAPAGVASEATVSNLAATTRLEIQAAGGNSRWRVAADGVAQYSSDAGMTWQAANTVSTGIRAGSSATPTVCWLVGRAGAVWLTTNGRQFIRVSFPQPLDLVLVRAVSARSATVQAADGRAFRTDDQGMTWQSVPSP